MSTSPEEPEPPAPEPSEEEASPETRPASSGRETRPWRRRIRRLLGGLLIACLVVLAFPDLFFGGLVRSRLESSLARATGGQVAVGDVHLSVTGRAGARAVRIWRAGRAREETPDVRVGAIDLDVGILALLGGELAVDRLRVRDVTVRATRRRDGSISLSSLRPAPGDDEEGAEETPFFGAVRLRDLMAEEVSLTLRDEGTDLELSVEDVVLRVPVVDLTGGLRLRGTIHPTGEGTVRLADGPPGNLRIRSRVTGPGEGGSTPEFDVRVEADAVAVGSVLDSLRGSSGEAGPSTGAEEASPRLATSVEGTGDLSLALRGTPSDLEVILSADMDRTTWTVGGSLDAPPVARKPSGEPLQLLLRIHRDLTGHLTVDPASTFRCGPIDGRLVGSRTPDGTLELEADTSLVNLRALADCLPRLGPVRGRGVLHVRLRGQAPSDEPFGPRPSSSPHAWLRPWTVSVRATAPEVTRGELTAREAEASLLLADLQAEASLALGDVAGGSLSLDGRADLREEAIAWTASGRLEEARPTGVLRDLADRADPFLALVDGPPPVDVTARVDLSSSGTDRARVLERLEGSGYLSLSGGRVESSALFGAIARTTGADLASVTVRPTSHSFSVGDGRVASESYPVETERADLEIEGSCTYDGDLAGQARLLRLDVGNPAVRRAIAGGVVPTVHVGGTLDAPLVAVELEEAVREGIRRGILPEDALDSLTAPDAEVTEEARRRAEEARETMEDVMRSIYGE